MLAEPNGIFIPARNISGFYYRVTVSMAHCGETPAGSGQCLMMGEKQKGQDLLISKPSLVYCGAPGRLGFGRDELIQKQNHTGNTTGFSDTALIWQPQNASES